MEDENIAPEVMRHICEKVLQSDEIEPERSLSAQQLALDIRPEFHTQVAEETQPKCRGTFYESEAHRIEPVGIPLIGEKCSAVSAPDAPGGDRLATPVRACEEGTAKRMSRTPLKPRFARWKVLRVLMQRRVQTES